MAPTLSERTARPLTHPSLKDTAAEYIRAGIVSGQFGPGAKVDQDEIAGILGISRLPIREALIELSQKGYVVSIPRRGAFVTDLQVDDVIDHFEVLAMVFGLAYGRAAKTITPEQLAESRAIQESLKGTRDKATHETMHRSFYEPILEVGSSRSLRSILGFLSRSLAGSFYMLRDDWIERETVFRTEVLAALEARDSERASSVSAAHLRDCGRATVELLRERGYWADGRHDGTEG